MVNQQTLLLEMGKHIAQLRTQAGMTQEELAFKCGKDQQSIARLEKGRRNVSVYYLYEVANALGVPVKELINF